MINEEKKIINFFKIQYKKKNLILRFHYFFNSNKLTKYDWN